jgi:hypothetical protein
MQGLFSFPRRESIAARQTFIRFFCIWSYQHKSPKIKHAILLRRNMNKLTTMQLHAFRHPKTIAKRLLHMLAPAQSATNGVMSSAGWRGQPALV